MRIMSGSPAVGRRPWSRTRPCAGGLVQNILFDEDRAVDGRDDQLRDPHAARDDESDLVRTTNTTCTSPR